MKKLKIAKMSKLMKRIHDFKDHFSINSQVPFFPSETLSPFTAIYTNPNAIPPLKLSCLK